MISIQHLSHHIGTSRILHDVTLALGKGEFACLAGVSGSGKSTLLRLIAGLEKAHAGTIAIAGQTVSAESVHQPAHQRGVGIVFQHPSLFPHLTILENVMFGLDHLPSKEAAQRARALLEQVHFSGRERDYPHMLSGGQHQRVALARALAPAPAVMLLDEPFANLDSALRRALREETRILLKASGTTTLMVTHDPKEALMMADSVCLLGAGGEVLQTGTPRDLYLHPSRREVAAFFGEVNLLEGKVENGTFHCALGAFPTTVTPHASALLMLRPEAIQIASSPQEGAIEATVARTLFAGECQQVEVHVGKMAITVCDNAQRPFKLGEKVALTIPPHGAHFI